MEVPSFWEQCGVLVALIHEKKMIWLDRSKISYLRSTGHHSRESGIYNETFVKHSKEKEWYQEELTDLHLVETSYRTKFLNRRFYLSGIVRALFENRNF